MSHKTEWIYLWGGKHRGGFSPWCNGKKAFQTVMQKPKWTRCPRWSKFNWFCSTLRHQKCHFSFFKRWITAVYTQVLMVIRIKNEIWNILKRTELISRDLGGLRLECLQKTFDAGSDLLIYSNECLVWSIGTTWNSADTQLRDYPLNHRVSILCK